MKIHMLLSAAAILAAAPLFATDGTWIVDANGNWSNTADWTGGIVADGSGATANFTGNITADRTVTLDAAHTLTNLNFGNLSSSSNWFITGANTLTLAGTTPTLSVTNNSVTITSVVAGTAGLTKTGAGTLTLALPSSGKAYSGTTTVNGGTLKLDLTAVPDQTAYPIGRNVINASGVLELYNTTPRTANEPVWLNNTTISGSGTLRKTGAGYISVLYGNGSDFSAFTGLIDVQAGTLGTNGPNATNLPGFSTLQIAATAAVDIRAGTLAIDALNGVTGSTISASFSSNNTLSIGNGNGSGSFAGVISNGAAALVVIKNGTGTQTLSGANTYTGATTVNAGVLNVTGSLASAVTVNGGALNVSGSLGSTATVNGGVLNVTGSVASAVTVNASGTYAYNGTGTGAITLNSGGVLTGTGNSTNNITFNAGSGILLGASGSVQGATVTFAAGTNVFVNDAPTGGAVTREVIRYTGADPGTTTLTAASNFRNASYTDTAGKISLTYTAVNNTWNSTTGGTWQAGGAAALWSNTSDTNFYRGDAVTIGGTATQTITLSGNLAPSSVTVNNTAGTITLGGTGAIIGTGSLTKSGAGTLALTGANTYSGGAYVNDGTLIIAGTYTGNTYVNAGTLILSGLTSGSNNGNVGGNQLLTTGIHVDSGAAAVVNMGAVNFSSANTGTFISGSGILQLAGGTWWLGNGGGGTRIAMSSGGWVDVKSGTLLKNDYGNANWVSNNGSLNVGGSFDLRANNTTVDALTGSGAVFDAGFTNTLIIGVAGTANNATYGVAGNTATFSGTIGAGGTGIALIKNGSGTQVLSGTNTYTGATTANAGTLQFAKQVSLYNNTTASWTAANLVVASGATAAFNVGGTGEFTSANIDTLKALGTATGGFTAGARLGLDTTNAAGGNFAYVSAIANTNSGANSIGLDKLGANTLTLSGTNTYTGTTNVIAGTLLINGIQSAATGAITVAATATLGGAGTTGASLVTVNGNITGGTVATTGTLTANAVTLTATGAYVAQIASATAAADLLAVNGTLTLGGAQLTLTDINAGVFTLGNKLTLAYYSTISGTFSNYTDGEIFTLAGNQWQFSYNDGNAITITAVPEPATYGLLGAGVLAGITFLRRRRRIM